MYGRLLHGQLVILLLCRAAAGAEDTIDLRAAAETDEAVQAKVEFSIGGDLFLAGDEGERKVPMSVVARFSYEERSLATSQSGMLMTARRYGEADATIKIGDGGTKVSLPDERRLIIATVEGDVSTLTCPAGPLTREQLELIDVPAGTHLLSHIMPAEVQRVGGTFQHDQETMGLLLGLDTVSACDVESFLIDLERGYAKVRMSGSIQGTTDGAETELEVKAGYLFDMRRRRIARMNLAFAEKREKGRIGPGLDVVGKLSLAIDPLAQPEHLTDERVAAITPPDLAESSRLVVEDDSMGIRLVHDRDWHVTSHQRERLVFRRVADGRFIAQCNVVVRPEHREGRRPTLEEFEKDVRFSLGNRFKSLVSSGEWTNAAGLRCYRIVVHGAVDGLPMEWRYYLAAPSAGQSIAFSVSVEPQFTEALSDADRELVESIEIAAVANREASPSAGAVPKAATRAGRASAR